MSNTLDKATESDFWYFVSELKWGEGVKSAAVLKQNTLKRLPPYKASNFKKLAAKLAKNITNQINNTDYANWVITYAAYEVIGYGKAEYDRYVKQPELLSLIADSIEVVEPDNLFYNVLPSEDDYYFYD